MKAMSSSFTKGGGKNYWNICWAGRRGQSLFLRKKMKGQRLISMKKVTGQTLFLTKKMTGQRLFLSEFTNTDFLLLMLSYLTFDAERSICLNIVQFTTSYHCA